MSANDHCPELTDHVTYSDQSMESNTFEEPELNVEAGPSMDANTFEELELNVEAIAEFLAQYGILWRIGIVTLIILLTSWYMVKRQTKDIPSTWCIPLLGGIDMRYLSRAPHLALSNATRRYGDIFKLRLGTTESVVVNTYEAVSEAMRKHGAVYADRPDSLSAELIYGDRHYGISMCDYSANLKMKRKLIQNCFLNSKMQLSQDVIEKLSQATVRMCWEFKCYDNEVMNPRDLIACGVLNTMTFVLFNKQYEYNDTIFLKILYLLDIRFKSSYSMLADFIPILRYFPSSKATALNMTHKFTNEFLSREIDEHKDTYGTDEFNDVLDHILREISFNNDEGLLDESDLIYMFFDILVMGFEPVTALFEWIMVCMAKYHGVQVKVQAELDAVVGRQRLPKVEDMLYLPYCYATLCEVQRLATIMPLGLPHKTMSNTKLQGYNIPKNSVVLFNLWHVHHDRRHWKDPEAFLPSRFLDELGEYQRPENFIPFGLGQRSCLGGQLAEAQSFLFFVCLMHQMSVLPPERSKSVNVRGEYINFVHQPESFTVRLRDNSTERDDIG